jgi:hypothetical protein
LTSLRHVLQSCVWGMVVAAIIAGQGEGQGVKTSPKGGKRMITVEVGRGFEQFKDVSVPGVPLHDVAAPAPIPRAPVEGTESYSRPFGDQRMNSRLPYALAAKPLKAAWTVPVDPAYPPLFVLQISDRVAIYSGRWQLFAMDGRPLASGPMGGGPLALDPATSFAFTFIPEGYLSARSLQDGREVFKLRPMLGDMYTRVFLGRHGSRLLIVGWERQLDPDQVEQNPKSLFEILDLGKDPHANEMGTLATGKPIGLMMIHSAATLAGSGPDSIYAAAPGHLYQISWNLDIKHAWEADFKPHAISTDEADRVFLTVSTKRGSEMWLVNPAGEILYKFLVPGIAQDLKIPPIIGFDHTAYLLAGQQIYAVSSDGKLQWAKSARRTLGGAIVTSNDRLVATEGSEIVSYDTKGQREILAQLSDDPFVTPPVLSAHGEILAATKTALVCFAAKN